MKLHLTPVGKPAPPRPRSPEALSSSMIFSGGVFSRRIFSHASYPPIVRYVFSVQLPGSASGSNTTWFISRGMRRSLQAVEHLIHLLRGQVLVVDVVDHHHRRVVARGEALLLALEVKLAVRRALAGL